MTSTTNDKLAPSIRQLHALEAARESLSARWTATPVQQRDHYAHWEDKDLDIPPRYRSAWFVIEGPPVTVQVATPGPERSLPEDSLVLTFYVRSLRDDASAWAAVMDRSTRRMVEAAGFGRGKRFKTWMIRDGQAESIVNEICETVASLFAAPWRVLHERDVPRGMPWPSSALLDVMSADRVVSIEVAGSGTQRITAETDGELSRTLVEPKGMEFLRWWWDAHATEIPKEAR